MGDPGSTSRSVLGRARTFVMGRPTSQKVGGGVAAALLASAPFGGLSGPAATGPAPIALEQAFTVGPYRVTIDQVVELPDLKPAVSPGEGERVLVLDAAVENVSDRPDYAVTLTDNLHLTGGDVELVGRPSLVVVDDSSTVSVLNPDVPYRLAITYTTKGAWQGDTATLAVPHLEFIEVDPLTLDDLTWRERNGPGAKGTLPVVRRS